MRNCCYPHRDATKFTFFTTAGRSTQRSCVVASFRDKQPRGAGDFFFLFLRFALQTKALLISSNHNALIADKYRGVRHRIKTVSCWPRSEINNQNCSVRREHMQSHVTTASAWRVKDSCGMAKRKHNANNVDCFDITSSSSVQKRWLNLQKLYCVLRADLRRWSCSDWTDQISTTNLSRPSCKSNWKRVWLILIFNGFLWTNRFPFQLKWWLRFSCNESNRHLF